MLLCREDICEFKNKKDNSLRCHTPGNEFKYRWNTSPEISDGEAFFGTLQRYKSRDRGADRRSERKSDRYSSWERKDAGIAETRGSVTLEAALALPIFIFFIATLLSLFSALKEDIKAQYELAQTAHAAAALSNADEDIELRSYTTSKIAFVPESVYTLVFAQEVCIHSWSGRTINDEQSEEDDEEYVYVAEHGTVYHTTSECSYLTVKLTAVSSEIVGKLRNSDGAKYYACESCGGGEGTVYIAESGNRYHSSPDCKAIKKKYTKIKRSQTSLPGCSKCAGE